MRGGGGAGPSRPDQPPAAPCCRGSAMSCYWDALMRELNDDEVARAGLAGVSEAAEFALRLQRLGAHSFVLTKWQGRDLPEQARRENAAAVQAYDPADVNNGYLCGSCDPFLLLVAHVAGVHIRHCSLHGTFEYTSMLPSARWIHLHSDAGHMR